MGNMQIGAIMAAKTLFTKAGIKKGDLTQSNKGKTADDKKAAPAASASSEPPG